MAAVDASVDAPTDPIGGAASPVHTGSMWSARNLAGDLDGARQSLERALEISEATLGPADPRTRQVVTLLANLTPGSASTT
jgi:hypothetical protein